MTWKLCAALLSLVLCAGCATQDPERASPDVVVEFAPMKVGDTTVTLLPGLGVASLVRASYSPPLEKSHLPGFKGWRVTRTVTWTWGKTNQFGRGEHSATLYAGTNDAGQPVVNGQPIEGTDVTIRCLPDGRTDPTFPKLPDTTTNLVGVSHAPRTR